MIDAGWQLIGPDPVDLTPLSAELYLGNADSL